MKKLFCKKTLSAFLAIVMTFAAMAGMFTVSAGAADLSNYFPEALADGTKIYSRQVSDGTLTNAGANLAAWSGSLTDSTYSIFSNANTVNISDYCGVMLKIDTTARTTSFGYLQITVKFANGDEVNVKADGRKLPFIDTDGTPETPEWREMKESTTNWQVSFGNIGYGYFPFSLKEFDNYDGQEIADIKVHNNGNRAGVVISDLRLVYTEDQIINNASVTLTEDLSYNIYANVPAACTDAKVTFAMNGNTTEAIGVKQADGRYKYTLDGILPQFIGDDITATFTAKIGDKTVTDTYTTTLRKYCDAVLADTATDENTAILVKSLLHYGAEVQKYAGYKTSALCNEGIDAVTDVETTPNALANNDESVWLALGARLNGTITFKVKFAMPDGASKVTYSIGENAAVEATVEDGYVLIPVMAYQFAENITVQCVDAEGTSVGGSLVVSLNCYLSFMDEGNAADLAKAMINYGRAAEAVKKN